MAKNITENVILDEEERSGWNSEGRFIARWDLKQLQCRGQGHSEAEALQELRRKLWQELNRIGIQMKEVDDYVKSLEEKQDEHS